MKNPVSAVPYAQVARNQIQIPIGLVYLAKMEAFTIGGTHIHIMDVAMAGHLAGVANMAHVMPIGFQEGRINDMK